MKKTEALSSSDTNKQDKGKLACIFCPFHGFGGFDLDQDIQSKTNTCCLKCHLVYRNLECETRKRQYLLIKSSFPSPVLILNSSLNDAKNFVITEPFSTNQNDASFGLSHAKKPSSPLSRPLCTRCESDDADTNSSKTCFNDARNQPNFEAPSTPGSGATDSRIPGSGTHGMRGYKDCKASSGRKTLKSNTPHGIPSEASRESNLGRSSNNAASCRTSSNVTRGTSSRRENGRGLKKETYRKTFEESVCETVLGNAGRRTDASSGATSKGMPTSTDRKAKKQKLSENAQSSSFFVCKDNLKENDVMRIKSSILNKNVKINQLSFKTVRTRIISLCIRCPFGHTYVKSCRISKIKVYACPACYIRNASIQKSQLIQEDKQLQLRQRRLFAKALQAFRTQNFIKKSNVTAEAAGTGRATPAGAFKSQDNPRGNTTKDASAGSLNSDTLVILDILQRGSNPWSILQVHPPKPGTLSCKELYMKVRHSYRSLVLKVHPDKNSHPRAKEVFELVQNAWSKIEEQFNGQRGKKKKPIG